MPLQHARVNPSKPGLTLVDASGTFHLFTWVQFREYVRFDRDLRAGCISAVNLVLPGGYSLFILLWNANPNCIYQFSSFDAATNSTTVSGAPFPDRLLDKLDPPPAPAASAASKPQFTLQHVRTIERMLWGSAEREARYLEHHDLMQDKHTEDRKRKRSEHRTADEAHASKAAAITSTTSSTGILSVGVGSGSSGGTTILSSTAARGSGSSGSMAGSSSGSSTCTTTQREASPMEEDKDAEGEKDQELIEYSDNETSDKAKAGKGKKRE